MPALTVEAGIINVGVALPIKADPLVCVFLVMLEILGSFVPVNDNSLMKTQ